MQLQSRIQEDANDVKFVYDVTMGWRIRITLNEPKSLAPKSKLNDGAIPITNTVVSKIDAYNYHIVKRIFMIIT